eukprot:TRINITY_DN16031_c0_g1_i1.p2 TRINITY_DN16031_c0_g1~~TRINITY_DN16031_c0_g1_i1.p2  ORF type:complete len:276 (+),score=17.39 TRINITY_DN16031_c0_g1_i1:834-1661(+)
MLPWECFRVRQSCREMWLASNDRLLWKRWISVVEGFETAEVAEAFKTEQVRRRWVQSLRSIENKRIQETTPKHKYKFYCKKGVVAWRNLIAKLFPPTLTGIRDRMAVDIVGEVVEIQVSFASLKHLTMADVDELHDVLRRTCTATATLVDAFDRLRLRNSSAKLADLHTYIRRLNEHINLITKVDQWMNCVTSDKYWCLLVQQLSTIGYQLPHTPSSCPVSTITRSFTQGSPEFRLIWDRMTVTARNDALSDESSSSCDEGPEPGTPCTTSVSGP